jgi:hypothetical protein
VLYVPLLTLADSPGTDWRLLVLCWRCSWFQDPAKVLHGRRTARCTHASAVHSAVLFLYLPAILSHPDLPSANCWKLAPAIHIAFRPRHTPCTPTRTSLIPSFIVPTSVLDFARTAHIYLRYIPAVILFFTSSINPRTCMHIAG